MSVVYTEGSRTCPLFIWKAAERVCLLFTNNPAERVFLLVIQKTAQRACLLFIQKLAETVCLLLIQKAVYRVHVHSMMHIISHTTTTVEEHVVTQCRTPSLVLDSHVSVFTSKSVLMRLTLTHVVSYVT